MERLHGLVIVGDRERERERGLMDFWWDRETKWTGKSQRVMLNGMVVVAKWIDYRGIENQNNRLLWEREIK